MLTLRSAAPQAGLLWAAGSQLPAWAAGVSMLAALRTCRLLSSSSGGGGGSMAAAVGGLEVVPFTVGQAEAAAAAWRYHTSGLLLQPPDMSAAKWKEAFVPYWAATAHVQAYVKRAEIGRWVRERVFNAKEQKWETQERMKWVKVPVGEWMPDATYGAEKLQLVANSKWPESDLHVIRPGAALRRRRALHPSLLQPAPSGSAAVRKVVPFTMSPFRARSRLREEIEALEEDRAVAMLRSRFVCDAANAWVDVTLSGFALLGIWAPVHVFSYRYSSLPGLLPAVKLRTFVSGANARLVSGPVLREPLGVAVAVGAVAAFAACVGAVPPEVVLTRSPLAFAVIPAVSAGVFVAVWPLLRRLWDKLPPQDRRSARISWDDAAAYNRSRPQRRPRSCARNSARDPKGYYALLGVAPDASVEEIQESFRGLALKMHPDMEPDPRQKKEATEAFRKLLEAYRVLRNRCTRTQYDKHGPG